MGISLTDFKIESVIRAGLTAIRENPLRLDDLFSEMKLSYLDDHFGQTEIDKIKSWLDDNRINIVQGWPQAPSEIPCVSINLRSAVEATEIAIFGDDAEYENTEAAAEIVETFTPTSYDPTSGKIAVADGVDLSDVNTSLFFIDGSEVSFEIKGISDVDGSKYIIIDPDEGTPTIIEECMVVENIDFTRATYNMIPIHEKVQLGIHTENAVKTRYLYYIILYIFQIRRDTMIRRFLELTHFSASDFVREPSFLPENIFSRYITLDAITRFYYKEEQNDLVGGSGIVVRTVREGDETARIDEEDFNVRTVEGDE